LRAWRIARVPYADLTGEGARLFGGRWNSPGSAVVYLAEHPALAMLEILVHLDLDPAALPVDYVLMTVAIPDGVNILDASVELFAGREFRYGDEWIMQKRSLLLRVPSAVMPQSSNVLLNPAHVDAERVALVGIDNLNFDARLAS
jgi:RES domain-containing protein